ncbi:WD40 repeat-like protein [Aspergillus niger ATCC 13496]|uniref:WD40 repeat-like protein n=1 Tax=Aspergillus niger ATCC 13496 TaxID=1353008 RepID=A0A370BH96_ASPNG|nr:WD40 repeat-like protein [Aspergillus niger ATCC 13496]
MASTVTFRNTNTGLQIGFNSGTVHSINNFTDPLDKLPITSGAAFDSYTTNQDDSQCLPGTRADLLEQIEKWVRSPDESCFFWLQGMAGTGKSTIARTLASSFKAHGSTVVSFFFKRGEQDRGNARGFFATISKQLAVGLPDLSPGIREAISSDPDITAKSLKKQFDTLIFQPLVDLGQKAPRTPLIMVIDALDECEVDNDIRDILQILPLVQELPIRFRILLTSRPELPVRLGFARIADYQYKELVLHELPESTTAYDISLFLKDRLTQIKETRDVPDEWPTEDQFNKLVALSAPLFISAATICRFIETKLNPVESLDNLLRVQVKLKYASKMEQTYLPILMRLLSNQGIDDDETTQLLQSFQHIIGVIVFLAVPLSVKTLSRLLQIDERVINNLLNNLHSVISVPQDRTTPIRILHLSFRDFLVQTQSRFYVDMEKTHRNITRHCFTIMQSLLKQNICHLDSYRTPKSEIDIECIHQHLPQELQYSCRYWAHHLSQCGDSLLEISNAFLFLQEHFLHWVEVMVLLNAGAEVLGMLNILQSFLSYVDDDDLFKFLMDAKRFFVENKGIAEIAPLQLYSSSLVFAPEMAIIRRLFQREVPPWTYQLPKVGRNWNAALLTVEGVSEALALSPDSRLLASGENGGNTIRLWDVSGDLKQTLEGDTLTIAFSPDSRQLASGAPHGTIRIYDTATGALQKTLKCDTPALITSLDFFPDGQLLVACFDYTIRLWDTNRWDTKQTLEGHTSWVQCVAFSPDGRWLASGSNDTTVRIWDTATWTTKRILRGHAGEVRSVAFSHDGLFLASADTTGQIWDTATWTLSRKLEWPLRREHRVWSVAFSVDTRLACGYGNGVIKLWDTVTGTLQQTLEGHSDVVSCLAFSSDGQLLASLSRDGTARIWEISMRAPEDDFEGHPDPVHEVQFSPDGRILVSTSHDDVIRLWNPATGALQQIIRDVPSLIEWVQFSPDSRLLACSFYNSGVSRRQFIWIWNISTKSLKQQLVYDPHEVRSIAFSPDSRLMACGRYKSVEILDITNGATQTNILKGSQSTANPVLFSPDCRLLASGYGSYDRNVRLWDTTTWEMLYVFEDYAQSTFTMSFSPNSQLLAFTTLDKSIKLWHTATGALRQTLTGHKSPATGITFSPNGLLLASTSKDQTVRVWSVVTGAMYQKFEIQKVAEGLQFSLDGSFVTFNHGSFDLRADIQTNFDGDASSSATENYRIELQNHQWINIRGGGALWLPPVYRPSCSAMSGNILALGHSSGRVSFFSFLIN